MIEWVIEWSVRNRFLVLIGTGALIGAGVWSMATTPLDAIPDLSDVQVIVQTDFREQAPGIVEDQVTYPITTEMLKVPGARVVRGGKNQPAETVEGRWARFVQLEGSSRG